LWLIAALVVVWLLVIAPFLLIAVIANGSHIPAAALVSAVLLPAGVTFGVLLPYLLLSFTNGFYRERLKGLLHLGSAPSPPVITPPVPAVAGTAGT
jgi:hypothetical protein